MSDDGWKEFDRLGERKVRLMLAENPHPQLVRSAKQWLEYREKRRDHRLKIWLALLAFAGIVLAALLRLPTEDKPVVKQQINGKAKPHN